jgi:hypothetical protein
VASYQVGFSNSTPPAGTVGYWQFNNPTNVGADSSGKGNTLVVNGSGQLASQWYSGQGMVDGYVADGVDDFGISLLGDNIAFGVGNPDTTITATNALDNGQWYHVAATRSALTGLMQLYVNGVLQASATGPFGPKTSPPNLSLGGILAGVAGGFFSGALDDVQIFGSVLSATEIADVMNQSLTVNPIANTNLMAGQTLIVSNSAVDPYAPPATLTWSLAGAPAGATIAPASGTITWRPTISQSPTTNLFSVSASDNGSPSVSGAQSFLVSVSQPASPQISSPSINNGLLQFIVTGDSGPDYIIQSSTNLGVSNGWQPVYTNSSPPLPFTFATIASSNMNQRFYRVRLGP